MNKTKIIQDIIVNLISISNDLEALVETLNASIVPEVAPEKTETVEKEPSKDEAPKPKQPTLEEVREAMAEKNREGHREEVKAIIVNYGANKLTALDPKCYAEVLKEVGEIK